ncbi:MAG: hypothetical protein ACLGGX_05390 [Bdellovibrionia bacterium]
MKLPSTKRAVQSLTHTIVILPLFVAQVSFAQSRAAVGAPELFPIDNSPSFGGSNDSRNSRSNNNSGNNSSYQPPRVNAPTAGKMNTANVPDEYSCPLFENKPHQELIMAIDALTREVRVAQECSNQPVSQAIDQHTKVIRDSVTSLNGSLAITDASAVNVQQIEATVAAAISATQNLGEILSSNTFINSNCGRQTMSSGKALLAFNDILNGLSPYALLAVSMNAALTPALPYVIGGVVASSAISVMGKMIDQGTLDMTRPEHRKAVLENTCQFIKVAKKVRFMQLAQSGRIEKITEELEKNMQMYNARFAKPSKELSNLLSLKDSVEKSLAPYEAQLLTDKDALRELDAQNLADQDEMMTCMIGAELYKLAQEKKFPQTVFVNLEKASATSERASKIQVATLKALNTNSQSKISTLANQAITDESAVKSCASVSRSWIGGIRQAVQLTQNVVASEKDLLEKKLNESAEYRTWKTQYTKLRMEELTIRRVEKAMEELAKDNSIINRSELDQRMRILKAGLFGRNVSFAFGRPPVLAWLEHTKSAHDMAVSQFINGFKILRNAAWTLTDSAKAFKEDPKKFARASVKKQMEDNNLADKLATLTIENLPVGTREHELACQYLESTWIDWSAAVDHLGATQFFCDLIDGTIDPKIDRDISMYCRGTRQIDGTVYKKSVIDAAKDTLVQKGFQQQANIVAKQMKTLRCPLPGASVMN